MKKERFTEMCPASVRLPVTKQLVQSNLPRGVSNTLTGLFGVPTARLKVLLLEKSKLPTKALPMVWSRPRRDRRLKLLAVELLAAELMAVELLAVELLAGELLAARACPISIS